MENVVSGPGRGRYVRGLVDHEENRIKASRKALAGPFRVIKRIPGRYDTCFCPLRALRGGGGGGWLSPKGQNRFPGEGGRYPPGEIGTPPLGWEEHTL